MEYSNGMEHAMHILVEYSRAKKATSFPFRNVVDDKNYISTYKTHLLQFDNIIYSYSN